MICENIKTRCLRSAFVVLVTVSFIMIAFINLGIPSSWEIFSASVKMRNGSQKLEPSSSRNKEQLLAASTHYYRKKAGSRLNDHSPLQIESTDSVRVGLSYKTVLTDSGCNHSNGNSLSRTAPYSSSQQKDAFFRPWDRLEQDKPFWQSLDDKMDVVTYAAHYDDVENLPIIRVIGNARVPLPYSSVTCRYHGCLHCPVMHCVSGSVAHFRKKNGRRYIGAFVLCPLPPSDDVLPFAVSIRKKGQASGTLPVIIHYSNTTHSRQSARVQDLMKQRGIVLEEGDLQVFRSLWTTVRNETLNTDPRDVDFKARVRSGQDPAGTKTKSESDEKSARTADHHVNTAPSQRRTSSDIDTTAMRVLSDKTHGKDNHERNITLDNSRQHANNNNNNNNNNNLASTTTSGGTAGEYRWNVTRCFPAFQKHYDQHVLLAEMVAASRAVGVDHFTFYVESVGRRVNTTLQVLQSRGLAEVLPWNLHLNDPVLFYKGQFSAIQDCLYRHLRSSRYVLTADVDELLMPKTSDSLVTLLNAQFAKKPQCGSFQFLNTFFDLKLPPPSPPPRSGQRYTTVINTNHNTTTTSTNSSITGSKGITTLTADATATSNNNNNNISKARTRDSDAYSLAWSHSLPIFLHTLRQVRIFKPGHRSKIALDPRRVEVGSVHVVEKLRKGFRSCVMNIKEGLLHHYRHRNKANKVVEDARVKSLGDSYVKEAVSILEEVDEKMS